MEFIEITKDLKASPGEYIFHIPTRQVVLCGAFNREDNTIKALGSGRLFIDKISNFQKIKMNRADRKHNNSRKCKGCQK